MKTDTLQQFTFSAEFGQIVKILERNLWIIIILNLIEVLFLHQRQSKTWKGQGFLDEGIEIVRSMHQAAYPFATDRVGPAHRWLE